MADRLVVRGAREHNLKDVSLDLPRDAMIVFTGLSGSGKSSLAFDTIFAEGQRRYVESLSAYARQFLGQMDKPDVDFIDGLSPAVSIDQKSASRNPRSTVGTITEVYDYLRLLFARIGRPHCPWCGRPIARQSPQQIVDRVLELAEGTRFQVLAPVVRGRKGEYGELLRELQTKGYSRARVDGTIVRLDEALAGQLPALKKYEKHDIEVIVDRLAVKETARRRLTDSVETALGLSAGVVVLDFVDLPENDPHRERMYSEHLACLYDDLSFDELEPRSFSFNSPWGACPDCTGLGTKLEVDPELIVPDESKSLADGAIAPWSGGHISDYFFRLIEALGDSLGFRMDTPWAKLPPKARTALLRGYDLQVHVRYKNRYGRQRSYYTNFEGVIPWVERRHAEAESDSSREKFAGYMREVPCPSCHGARLKPVSLAVTVDGKSIAELCALPIGELAKLLLSLQLSERDQQIAQRIVKEVNARMGFLLDVGLDYLTLDRASATLAGGEAQRIRLATQIGSGLVGVLYVLDEPSIGLHQRDNHRLLETLLRLRNLGNTLIVVEHDEDTIRAADWIVDIGPRAGEHGGNIVVSGTVEELLSNPESLTGAYLSGRESIPVPAIRRKRDRSREVAVKGAAEHNLRGVDVAFPLGCLVAVTGVSGSGKSTLVNDILYKALARELNGARTVPGRHTRITGIQQLDKVVHVDQGPIGRTPRSNPATYTGVFDHVRQAVRGHHRGEGPRLPAGPVLLQRQGRPVRGLLRRRHPEDRDAVPARRLRALRGLPRRPVQHRHPGRALQGQDHRRGPRHADRGGRGLLRPRPRHPPAPQDARRRRPRLRPPRPARAHLVRRRGPAGQARRRTAAPGHRPDHLRAGRADHRAALRGHPQAARRAEPPRRDGQHGHRDRAQPGRDQDRGLGDRPRPRRRRRRRSRDRLRDAGEDRRSRGELHRPVPQETPRRLGRRHPLAVAARPARTMSAVEIVTEAGVARADLDGAAAEARFLLVLTHGAGGSVEAPDVLAARDAGRQLAGMVARVTQPYLVAGARAPGSAVRQDAAWVQIVAALRELAPGVPLVQGGRSNGARVACRTAAAVGARAVIALAFPLHPPGRAAPPRRSARGHRDPDPGRRTPRGARGRGQGAGGERRA